MSSFAGDLKLLASDSGFILFSKVATMGVGFLAHTLLVRNLNPDVFGTFSLALTVVSVCAVFAAIGMDQAVTRFISASDDDEANEYIVIAVTVVLVSGLLLMGGLFVASVPLASFFAAPRLAELLWGLVVLVLLRPLGKVFTGVVRGFEKTRWKVVSSELLPHAVSLPVLFYFVIRGKVLFGALLFYLVRPIVRIALLSLNLVRWGHWEFKLVRPTRERVSETLSFAWPLAFENVVVVFLGSIDILMLGWFAESAKVGLYRSVQPVARTIIFLLSSMTFIYLPIATRYFSDDDIDELNDIYKTATRWVAHGSFPLFLFYLVFGSDFIRVIFGGEYVGAWGVLAILSVGMYSRVLAGPNSMTIMAIDRTREDLLASIGALVTNATLNYLLIPRYGINGAAIATTIGYLVYNTVDLAVIYRYVRISPFNRALFKPLLPTVLVTLAFAQLTGFAPTSFVMVVSIGIAISLLHLVSVVATTGLTENDRVLIDGLRGG